MKKIFYIGLLFLLTLVLINLFNLDLKIAYLFYKPGQPFWDSWSKNLPFWSFIYKYGPVLPNAVGGVSLLILLSTFFTNKFKQWRRQCVFAVLLLALAPGFIVQTMKHAWGRPRPIELKIFNGMEQLDYKSPFQPSFKFTEHENDGASFPSGHAAVGFYMLVFYFIFNKRKSLLLAGLAYGGLMAFGRIAQGGHFLSDVLTSLFIVYITAESLYIWLLKSKQ